MPPCRAMSGGPVGSPCSSYQMGTPSISSWGMPLRRSAPGRLIGEGWSCCPSVAAPSRRSNVTIDAWRVRAMGGQAELWAIELRPQRSGLDGHDAHQVPESLGILLADGLVGSVVVDRVEDEVRQAAHAAKCLKYVVKSIAISVFDAIQIGSEPRRPVFLAMVLEKNGRLVQRG